MPNVQECSENSLVQMYREGSSESGEALYLRYWPKVCTLAERVLKSHADAEDVAQDVLIKVILEKKLLAFRGRAQLWSWLYRITLNACKSRLRKNRRVFDVDWSQEEAANHQWHLTAYGKDPESQAIENEQAARLQAAMENLAPAYRQGIQTICLGQRSYTEGAQALSVPLPTLGVRVMRAKAKLAQWLRVDKAVQPKSHQNSHMVMQWRTRTA